ncbi:hypothetical protein [Microbacterium sp.]|uniref:PH-like domain-containing protein n=1 Tax=Microbacterium sp. TaxID=51671 RepID=UPI0028117235|nr:hypothetical protein [Microbacterium sp.]
MSHEAASLIFVAIAVIALALMVWGWRRRARRDARVTAPVAERRGAVRATFTGLYVATTRHDEPLDRLNVKHLAFRSRVTVTVTDAGVALDMPGEPTVFLDAPRLRDAGRATWTIDRVVEYDGLVLLAWTADDGTICDSYVRLQNADPDALVSEVQRLRTDSDSDSTQMGAQR